MTEIECCLTSLIELNKCPFNNDIILYIMSYQAFSLKFIDDAACSGRLDCLQYAHSMGHQFKPQTLTNTAINGHLDCLRFLYNIHCPVNALLLLRTISSGHIDCVKFIHENIANHIEMVCVNKSRATRNAAFHGHYEILKYLINNGYSYDINIEHHMSCRNIECLKYLHELGCTWDDRTISSFIARNKPIEMLKYAHEHGAPYDDRALEYAQEFQNINGAKYLLENGYS